MDSLGFVWGLLMVALLMAAVWRVHRRRGHLGPGAAGLTYDLLNEDRREALEIIVEQGAEKRRPEYPDGNLPDLEAPRRTRG